MLSRSRFPSATALCSVLHLLASCATAAPFDFLDSYRHTSLALRDAVTSVPDVSDQRSLLPAQICGIVGGYVATVLIWGILLLTVGRKMRSRRFENPPAPLDVELVNARPQVRILTKTPASPGSARSVSSWSKKIFSKKDKTTDSAIGSPQSPVVQSPSSFDQNVLDANKERAQAEMERLYAAVMEHDRKKSYSQVSADEVELNSRRPSAINTSREVPNYSNPSSPVKAIYPPNYHNGPPTAPLPRDRLRDPQPPSSPRSILSKKSHTSNASTGSKARFNLKNLRISGPVGKYPSEPQDDEARTPLSPRFYNPGAPPSPPTMQNSPTTPGTIEEAYEQLDEVQPLPRPAPQRAGSSSAATPTGTQPPALQITKSTASSNSSLPLRGYAEPLKSPDLRTTVLDRKINNLSMTTPKTGVPFTPYSPYMPFTPITPVTPHLVTKKERKMMHKMEKRRQDARDEMVQSPKEIFGDAY